MGFHVRPAPRVVARDTPVIDRDGQDRVVPFGVARDEHGGALRPLARLAQAGRAVGHRHAVLVQAQPCVLQREPLDVRLAPRRGQRPVEALRDRLGPLRLGEAHAHALLVVLDGTDVRVEEQRELGAQHVGGDPRDRLVRQRRDAAALGEAPHADAEPRERLRRLDADHARPEDDDGIGQGLHLEEVRDGEAARPRPLSDLGRDARRRARRDHHPPRAERLAVHQQHARLAEAGRPAQPVRLRDRERLLDHALDEAVAQRVEPRHHRRAVHGHRARAHAERVRLPRRVRVLGGGDQELGRHAARARAGRPVGAVLDQDHVVRVQPRGLVGLEPRRARADDGDIHGPHRDTPAPWRSKKRVVSSTTGKRRGKAMATTGCTWSAPS